MSAYSRFLRDWFLPAHNLVFGRTQVEQRRFLEASQWWPQNEVLHFQWQELRALLKTAFEEVPYYKKKYAGISWEDIRSWDDFRKLPILTRAEISEHREQLYPPRLKSKLLPHATGGSSGVPLRFYKTIESYDWRTAATQRAYSWSGYTLGEPCLLLWGAPVGKPSFPVRLKAQIHNTIQRHLIVPTFVQNETVWRDAYQKARRFQPRFMIGYVSSLVGFARYLEAERLTPPALKAILTAAEPLNETVRAYISRVLGAPVFNTYGSREFMSLAGECEHHRGMHINVENVVVETVEDSSHGPSELLVTDLHNLGTVFIRYAIGDLGVLSNGACACGRGLPVLESVEGRTVDVLELSDGRAVSGLFFCHTLKDIPEILEFQVQQKGPRNVQVQAVLSAELSENSRLLFQSEMRKAFGDIQVELEPVAHIPKSKSGKHRPVVGLS